MLDARFQVGSDGLSLFFVLRLGCNELPAKHVLSGSHEQEVREVEGRVLVRLADSVGVAHFVAPDVFFVLIVCIGGLHSLGRLGERKARFLQEGVPLFHFN